MDNIYILESNGFYKIGVSADIDARIKNLQIGNPHIISHVFSRMVPEAYEVEQELHDMFAEYRIKGEWFKFDTKTLEILKDQIVFYMRLHSIGAEDAERIKRWWLLQDHPKCRYNKDITDKSESGRLNHLQNCKNNQNR